MIKVSDLAGFLAQFKDSTTVGEIKDKIKSEYPYECPKCKGKGQVYIEDCFGDGRTGNYWIKCNICNGYGRTHNLYTPKYVIDRYVEE